MKRNKIALYIVAAGLLTALIMGCGSSTSIRYDRNDTNDTEIGSGEASFSGGVIGNLLEELGNGAAGEIGGDSVGFLLSLLGWGNPSDANQEKMLSNINNKLDLISNEIQSLEKSLETLIKEVITDIDTLKKDGMWPKDEIKQILDAEQTIDGFKITDDKPIGLGEGNQTELLEFANTWIGNISDHGMTQINGIYYTFNGSISSENKGILVVYTDQALLNLGFKEEYLSNAYAGLESLTSQLIGYQSTAMNYTVDSYHVKDDNSSAQKWFNCFYEKNGENGTTCNILYNEVGNMEKAYSFIYNAVSLVLHDAPIYKPFLFPSAENILKRAEFYSLVVRGEKAFGLRIFHISTADMPKSPDTLYVAKDRSKEYACDAVRHVVKGREYDFWSNNTVSPSSDYNVVEYNCGAVPNGDYEIFSSDDLSANSIGIANVTQYDSSYETNSSGTISYGFGLLTKNIANRFPESSDKWSIQKPGKDNYYSSTSGSANSWPIKAYASSSSKYGNGYWESNAHIELDGHFTYDENAKERTMYVDYHAKFYTKADSPYSGSGGGDAYSYYYVGVWDDTAGNYASDSCKNSTYYRLHAETDHSYSGHHDVTKYCSFTAKPGHHYYIYFKMVANVLSGNLSAVAESELDTVYRAYIMFSR